MRSLNYIPLLGFVILILTLYYSMSMAYNPKEYVYKISETKLDLVSGDHLDLKHLKGKFYVLHLFASWCGSCKENYPLLEKIKKETNAVIIGIAVRDNKPKENLIYDYLAIDKDLVIPRMLKSQSIPETLIINPQGMVIFHYVGVLDRKELEDNVIPNLTSELNTK